MDIIQYDSKLDCNSVVWSTELTKDLTPDAVITDIDVTIDHGDG